MNDNDDIRLLRAALRTAREEESSALQEAVALTSRRQKAGPEEMRAALRRHEAATAGSNAAQRALKEAERALVEPPGAVPPAQASV
jgi:hypothetical protein